MDGVDVQMSMTSLAQMDRHQTDTHRGPIVNQEQNADAARQEAAHRMQAPVAAEKSEGKTIDPRARRDREEEKKKRRRNEHPDDDPTPGRRNNPTGRFIDFEA